METHTTSDNDSVEVDEKEQLARETLSCLSWSSSSSVDVSVGGEQLDNGKPVLGGTSLNSLRDFVSKSLPLSSGLLSSVDLGCMSKNK
jgi:hypothetical protein